jgi:hypothetical protein
VHAVKSFGNLVFYVLLSNLFEEGSYVECDHLCVNLIYRWKVDFSIFAGFLLFGLLHIADECVICIESERRHISFMHF